MGALLASFQFSGRGLLIVITNTLLGLPPVVVGLVVYLLISRTGPLGFLDILYSPAAMMMAQFILVLPLSIALSRQVFEGLHQEYKLLFKSLNLSWKVRGCYVVSRRAGSAGHHCAGLFRARDLRSGCSDSVGGNIKHVTRVMTSAIALETARGELAFALALGIVLLFIALVINIISQQLRQYFTPEDRYGWSFVLKLSVCKLVLYVCSAAQKCC